MGRLTAALLAAWLAASGGAVVAQTSPDPQSGDGDAPPSSAEDQQAPVSEAEPHEPPAAVLTCLDPHTGATRQSDTGDCLLGERQVLPQAPAPPVAQRETHAESRAGTLSPCLAPTPAIVGAERAVRAGLAAASRPYLGAGVEEAADTPVNARNSVLFGRGRIIVETAPAAGAGGRMTARENEVLVADLASLSARIDVASAAEARGNGWSRLTLTCASAKCWSTERPTGGKTGRPALDAVSFLMADAAQAQRTAQAFGELILSCGGPR